MQFKEDIEIRGIEFVYIPPGEFLMGSPESGAMSDERPQHLVRITQGFYLGKYPVTQAQYECVMGKDPSVFKGPDRPVEWLTQREAVAFCDRLGMCASGEVRLPTEAEWEYACRAGTQTRYYFGDDDGQLGDYAWYRENADQQTHPVGQKKPNAWGLYDMLGNVCEWCLDCWCPWFYAESPTDDPIGPQDGATAISRGGSWDDGPWALECAARIGHCGGGTSYSHNGFRCAITACNLPR